LKGYSVLDWESGDLNKDGIQDAILILRKDGEDSTSDVIEHPEARPLLLLIRSSDGKLNLAARNDSTVYCINCGGMLGDPYTRIVIKKGYFTIEHYGGSSWRWTRDITYKYSTKDKCWYLHRDGTVRMKMNPSYNPNAEAMIKDGPDEIRTEKDFGKVRFENFSIYKED
ncbi:MAG: hypothetical protein Q8919_08280, partial [Bacteroidota bacterium]|nr:hypothetical protein [Bacteroidota bacterium]